MFQPVESQVSFPAQEARVLEFWRRRKVYDQSLARRAGAPRFVFYEGPPTANGLPHPGHCLTRAIKDLFPRYRTMRGYLCERKAGWDTHGLPVEVEVCKELGIHSKEEIEAFGVEPFIHRCLESVFRYTQQWERLTERLGFWIHLDDAYVTYHQSFVESVWWALETLFNRGLLYQGHKIVWWWAQGGTALSSGEVGQGYRQVADPSVYVRFPLRPLAPGDSQQPLCEDEPPISLLVWTTTPWTLPSNQFAAVKADLEYALVRTAGEAPEYLVVAAALAPVIAEKSGHTLEVVGSFLGSELVGRQYEPPLDYFAKPLGDCQGRLRAGGTQPLYWRVVAADFVTIDSGTGLVHEAPAFGEVDFDLLQSEQARFEPGEGPDLFCPVGPDGRFTAEVPEYQGRWVKEADKEIVRALKAKNLLFHQEQYLHDYPFCWRAEQDPLIQYPRRSWFVRTTWFKDQMLANNSKINWQPEHIRDGRFGNFLESNVDWALSRERYWGTPLPIWVCQQTGQMQAVGSYAALLAKPGVQGTEVWAAAKAAQPELSEHLRIHKPYIDAVTYDSPFAPGARMRRVGEVIDCWFDSGAMPFAQWGYPHQGQTQFSQQFPADFISEAIDQTRGWFYSQLAISTLLFGPAAESESAAPAQPLSAPGGGSSQAAPPASEFPHPFRNCIVLGLMLGEDGTKMSKSRRNYREPGEIFERYGADALRWYFFANQPPWTTIRYSEQAIKDSVPEFLLRLWNVYSFFVIYARIDNFDPAESLPGKVDSLDSEVWTAARPGTALPWRPAGERSELDRWILGYLHQTLVAVTERMDAYDNFAACQAIIGFVDALSNWYVRRSRDRFWASGPSPAKADAYWTLYECLTTTAKLVAPFVPFLAESLWQNLVVQVFGERATESVHLCDWPEADPGAIDHDLVRRMNLVREIASAGRSTRMVAKLKVRQPLAKVEVILTHPADQPWLEAHSALIAEELNVKLVEFAARADQYVNYTVLPNLKRLGPRLGKQLPALKQALAAADPAQLLADLDEAGQVSLTVGGGEVALDREDLQVRLEAKPGWAAAPCAAGVVVLATELTPELLSEGLARELVHAIQNRRKELDCQYTDRIRVGLLTESAALAEAAGNFADYVQGETLATQLVLGPIEGVSSAELSVGGHAARLAVAVVGS